MTIGKLIRQSRIAPPDTAQKSERKPERIWSSFQEDIFKEVKHGRGHLVVQARAGAGKSTTIEEAIRRMNSHTSSLAIAFGKDIADALAKRLPKQVETRTVHSLGYKAIRNHLSPKVEKRKTWILTEDVYKDSDNADECAAAVKAVSLCKTSLLGSLEEIDYLIDEFDLDVEVEEGIRRRFCERVVKLLEASKQRTDIIDYGDMIWMPHLFGYSPGDYRDVFIDEVQDLTPGEIALARAAGLNGRIAAIGDPAQAIFAFKGADEGGMARLIEELNAKVLPLSITYRCAQKIVEEVTAYVPDLTAAPGAPEGVVRYIGRNQALADLRPGDFVLSRYNAPLIGACFDLLRRGVKAKIRGKNIGQSLDRLIVKLKPNSVSDLRTKVRLWEESEITRLKRKGRGYGHIKDKAECVLELCEGASSVSDTIDRIGQFFSDDTTRPAVMLSTVHKAKGLEAERVFLLDETFSPGTDASETNIFYVAVTRAKRELVYVEGWRRSKAKSTKRYQQDSVRSVPATNSRIAGIDFSFLRDPNGKPN